MDYARFLEDHLAEVNRVVRAIAVTGHLSPADADDFRGEALVHLMADDYRVLRAFEGRSSLITYLNVVLRRLWQDRCARRWGRWRPSAEARRLGPAAMRLEGLVQRDGLSLDEAIATMQTAGDVDVRALRAQWRRLPARPRRRRVGDETLGDIADTRLDVAAGLDLKAGAAALSSALRRATRALSVEDRALLRLCFVDGASMADAARSLRLRQVVIYPRFSRLLRRLRTSLEADGLHAPQVMAHLGATTGSGPLSHVQGARS